jgi:predicted TIM-barrel fold metal-dependent hydrolase
MDKELRKNDIEERYFITDEDKAKIFGHNLGRLLGIDTTKRRIKGK